MFFLFLRKTLLPCLFTYVATFVSLQKILSQFPFLRNAVARFVQNIYKK